MQSAADQGNGALLLHDPTGRNAALLPELRGKVTPKAHFSAAKNALLRVKSDMEQGVLRAGDQRTTTLQVARLRTKVPTLSFIWMPVKPSWNAA